ncbi:hypothetical protein PG984_007277 [Apiospora sp. TS-2023a]
MADISLDTAALDQLHGEQKALLDTIDGLRKHGVGRFVDLPQIIVVGDQSSGKSSVLEAISRVRFPVHDKLCTRFPTELVLRTDDRTRVDVQIQRHHQDSEGGDAVPFSDTAFDKAALPEIIKKAKHEMLPDDVGFSEDVLRVEISGPDVPSLTLVDLPGFYHSEDDNQSAAGRDVVNRLAEKYMKKKNSIILAIISARNQLIMQEVLSKVKLHDKNKERTLGIITKPDLLSPKSNDEETFIRLMKNQDQSHKLSLGWHVLRNRSEFESGDSDDERDRKESDFFHSGPWQSSGLGEPRSAPRELRSHLDNIASQFHTISLHAVEGNYNDDFFGGLYAASDDTTSETTRRTKKLRALVRDMNRVFAHVLTTRGSRRTILPRVNDKSYSDSASSDSDPGVPSYLQDLLDKYEFERPLEVGFDEVAEELEDLSSANQGNEFPGTSNDRLAVELFREQSQPWEKIAHFHVRLVLDVSRHFVSELMGYIVSPGAGKTFNAILADIVDPFFEKKTQMLEDKVHELLHHYRTGHPQPLDAEFRMLLTARRRKNLEVEIINKLLQDQPDIFKDEALEKLRRVTEDASVSEFGVEGLIEKSETYYEMALRTFTDNVVILAIENCLIQELPSIFTTEMVNQMNETELDRLASESEDVREERAQLQKEHDALKDGLKSCNRYREWGAPSTPAIVLRLEDRSSRSSTTAKATPKPSPSATPRSSSNGHSYEAKSKLGTGASQNETQSPPSLKKSEKSVLPPGDPTAGNGFAIPSLGSNSTPSSSSTTINGSSQAKSLFGVSNTDHKSVFGGIGSQNKGGESASGFGAAGSGAQSSSEGGYFSFGNPTQSPSSTGVSFGSKPAFESIKSPFGGSSLFAGSSQGNSSPFGLRQKSSDRQEKGE